MTKQHTHWLYGKGPDKLLDFKIHVEAETDCSTCDHVKVCVRSMDQRCINFILGAFPNTNCQACSHKYTRYHKDAVPCFHCADHSAPAVALTFWVVKGLTDDDEWVYLSHLAEATEERLKSKLRRLADRDKWKESLSAWLTYLKWKLVEVEGVEVSK